MTARGGSPRAHGAPPGTATPIRALVVLGTRPEAVKQMPLIRVLASDPGFAPVVASTGQHREMTRQILEPFGIALDHDLDVMTPGQSLGHLVGRVAERIEDLYDEVRPDVVLVQGDTTSAFVAALAAFQRRVPVAHVEAGLRSHDMAHPFPEEANRRMIGVVAALHLAPTEAAAGNLAREGVPPARVVVTGNTAVDALLAVLARGESPDDEQPPRVDDDRPVVLVTLHRRESWLPGEGGESALDRMLRSIREAARRHVGLDFVYPVHPNPRVRRPAERELGDLGNVRLVEPLSYLPFVRLMAGSRLVLTDSGGIQEEAPSLGLPVLVLRETTERPEGVAWGTSALVGTDPRRLTAAIDEALDRPAPHRAGRPHPNPFGDGRAAERARDALLHFFGRGPRPEDFKSPAGASTSAGTTPGSPAARINED